MTNIIDEIYKLRSNFVVIGLTGRTGSGCSTVSKLLQSTNFKMFNPPKPNEVGNPSNDDRKYKITYKYLEQNWQKFHVIRAGDIITYLVLQHSFDEFCKSVEIPPEQHENLKNEYDKISKLARETKYYLEERRSQISAKLLYTQNKTILQQNSILNTEADSTKFDGYIQKLSEIEKKGYERINNFLFTHLPNFSEKIKDIILLNTKSKSYKKFQEWGDNIRLYGKAIIENTGNPSESSPSLLAYHINLVIKFIRDTETKGQTSYFVVDALRNPYEILYFRERYSAFYVMSINTEEKNRQDRLISLGFDKDSIAELDNKEYPDKGGLKDAFCRQNIQKCIELSDIHIVNPQLSSPVKHRLTSQLVHYLSLMTHPGLVPPTPIERVMQVAHTAKLNSGCLSRQVGAAVTDEKFSLKSIGWNNTGEGQTPCILRNFDDLLTSNDSSAYSDYERSDEKFRENITTIQEKYLKIDSNYFRKLKGKNLSYCFKDIQNIRDVEKNQVHTRSLHAEENAFLQISKYGGTGVQGGKLFTTASPCELCAKKAYQLGISEIYYIDPYPGISITHILNSGTQRPQLILFQGAIGRAYTQLYTPILSHKDELGEVLGCSMKDVFKDEQEKKSIKDLENKNYIVKKRDSI